MDWRSGDVLYDHSGNGKHGTIVGPSWEEIIPGCTDPYAENYNENANLDDGSCSGYPDLAENAISFDGTDDFIEESVLRINDVRSIFNAFVSFK